MASIRLNECGLWNNSWVKNLLVRPLAPGRKTPGQLHPTFNDLPGWAILIPKISENSMEITDKFPGALVVGTNHQRSLTKKCVCCCKLLPQCQASFFKWPSFSLVNLQ